MERDFLPPDLANEGNAFELSEEQVEALNLLHSGENVFLTGGAGSGKSFVIREFQKKVDSDFFPVLASTGAAAVLVGGRTFHSFFGLGIMEGGAEKVYEKASQDRRLRKRLKKIEGFILDEVSMIPGEALALAELLAREARGSSLPWGGLRVVAVGDFMQLPPVSRTGRTDWAFKHLVWSRTGFQNSVLKLNQRVHDPHFLSVLNEVRNGRINSRVVEFLDFYLTDHDEEASGTRLFPRREQAEQFNTKKLNSLSGEEKLFESIYIGEAKYTEILAKSAPVPSKLKLKKGCEVLFVQNDPQRRWVNGTRGVVVDFEDEKIKVEKIKGRVVTVERSLFVYQNADGEVLASLLQFPLLLGYASTIHRSQGSTLDEIWCDLGSLWEPGHAYVALSRLRRAQGLHLLRWGHQSFRTDKEVQEFYSQLTNS